jgi:DNA-directed RNA polymerase specialized sigma24 family protein
VSTVRGWDEGHAARDCPATALVVIDAQSKPAYDWQNAPDRLRSRHPGIAGIAFVDRADSTQPNSTQWALALQVVIMGSANPGNPAEQVAPALMAKLAKRSDEERVLVLHGRVLVGDAEAADEVAALELPRVRRGLRVRAAREEPEAIETAADDALLEYIRHPAKYDATRGSLQTWLIGIGCNRLKDLRRERRRRLSRQIPQGIDLSLYAITAPPDAAQDADEFEMAQRRDCLRAAARTPQERALVEAKLVDASMATQVEACGLTELPAMRARAIVYRIWENLVARAQRAWKRGGS